MLSTLAAVATWKSPSVDYHAILPEIILAAGIVVVLLVDLFLEERGKWMLSAIASFTLLGAFIPVVTLALSDSGVRSLFDGRYVIDDFSLVLKGLFILVGYVVVLLSTTYMEEGDYYRGEYWVLMLSSITGMVMISAAIPARCRRRNGYPFDTGRGKETRKRGHRRSTPRNFPRWFCHHHKFPALSE